MRARMTRGLVRVVVASLKVVATQHRALATNFTTCLLGPPFLTNKSILHFKVVGAGSWMGYSFLFVLLTLKTSIKTSTF